MIVAARQSFQFTDKIPDFLSALFNWFYQVIKNQYVKPM